MPDLRVAVTLEQCWHEVPGGTARAAIESCRALARSEVGVRQVGVAARHAHPPRGPWVPPVPVRMLPLGRLGLYESWHALRRPAVEWATGPVDVIHATGMAMPPRTVPLVVTVHDLAFLDRPGDVTRHGRRFFSRAIELARRDADLVMVPSQATADACVRHGFDGDRLRLVPWGVDATEAAESEVAEVGERFAITGEYVLWAGTLEPRKNLPSLLRAFGLVAREDVTLVLAGPQGWNEDVGPLVEALGHRVRQLGFVEPDDLRALYAGASVFCLPSLEEGFGLPVLEAMAQSTPVVTSAGTATEEVVGEGGLVVEPTDVAGLAAALDAVLEDRQLASRLGRAGRSAALERSWAHAASSLADLYQEAAGR